MAGKKLIIVRSWMTSCCLSLRLCEMKALINYSHLSQDQDAIHVIDAARNSYEFLMLHNTAITLKPRRGKKAKDRG